MKDEGGDCDRNSGIAQFSNASVCAAATEQMEINAQFYAVMQAVANQVEKSKQRFVPSFPSTPFDL